MENKKCCRRQINMWKRVRRVRKLMVSVKWLADFLCSALPVYHHWLMMLVRKTCNRLLHCCTLILSTRLKLSMQANYIQVETCFFSLCKSASGELFFLRNSSILIDRSNSFWDEIAFKKRRGKRNKDGIFFYLCIFNSWLMWNWNHLWVI